jgi:hypothetical protein
VIVESFGGEDIYDLHSQVQCVKGKQYKTFPAVFKQSYMLHVLQQEMLLLTKFSATFGIWTKVNSSFYFNYNTVCLKLIIVTDFLLIFVSFSQSVTDNLFHDE